MTQVDGVPSGTPGQNLDEVVGALRAGEVVGVPTDTVYGLAVDPSRPGATEALFALKGRPAGVAVAVLVADVGQAEQLSGPDGLSSTARRLVRRFWPGALTFVVRRSSHVGWDLGGDASTIGLRCPDHVLARRLCQLVGPLAATSANAHGQPPMTTALELRAGFGHSLVVVDGGRCESPPSTVVDLTVSPPACRRAGAVAWEEVLALLDEPAGEGPT